MEVDMWITLMEGAEGEVLMEEEEESAGIYGHHITWLTDQGETTMIGECAGREARRGAQSQGR
jgi:hypothetical protein